MAYHIDEFTLAGRAAYRTFTVLGGDNDEWDQIGEEEQKNWCRVAASAVEAFPGPISITTRIRLPNIFYNGMDIHQNISCDTTVEGITKMCEEYRNYLIKITENYRP